MQIVRVAVRSRARTLHAPSAVVLTSIRIANVAYEGQTTAGAPIGFTLTVFNTGTGVANGVTLSDVLPVKAGLSWAMIQK